MTQKFWKEVREIVNEALDMPTEVRSEYLDKACAERPELRAEVDSLLALEIPAKDFIETPALAAEEEEPREEVTEEGEVGQIGPYRILRKVGEGGMARVYEGQRLEEVQLKVAIKVIKPRLARREVLWRFKSERQILASLDHSNIARLRDAGTTEEGLPYFVMDLVDGIRLDRYCDENKLSVRDRVALFLKVCSAVSYAHGKMVVHRDLKPGNILVGPNGEPKLLDFGIAKLLEADQDASTLTTLPMTEAGAMPLTPGYASPEQFQGDTVAATSDVYSLGVVLYELLTGHNPHRIDRPELAQYRKAVVEDEPSRPSEIVTRTEKSWRSPRRPVELTPEEVSATRARNQKELRRKLAGDLDCIVMKALRKSPEDRYRSVDELAADLRAFLDGLPVEARRSERVYRISRLLKVHRWKLAGAAVIGLLLLALGWQHLGSMRLEQQQTTVRSFVGIMETAGESGEIDNRILELAPEGGLREMLDQLTEVALQLEEKGGSLKKAEKLHWQILETARVELGTKDELVLTTLNNLAANLTRQGRFEEAEDLHLEALGLKEEVDGERSENVLITWLNLASLYQDMGRLEKADEMAREIRSLAEGEFPHHLPVVMNNESMLRLKQGRWEEAEASYREVLEWLGDNEALREPRAITLRNLAVTLQKQGRTEEALEASGESVEIFYELYADRRLADAENVHGWLLAQSGEAELGQKYMARSLEVLTERQGEGARQTVEARERRDGLAAARASSAGGL